jgi:hypothetical protein
MARRLEVSYFENCNCEAVRARVELRRRDERPAGALALAPVAPGAPAPPRAMLRG